MNKPAPGAAPGGAEEHSRFIPALGAPRTDDGTQLRPAPAGPGATSPPPSAGTTMPPPKDLGITPTSKLEPVGAAPRAIAPAIQAGAPPVPRPETPSAPVVRSYAVTRYVCQPGDTLSSVSKQFYRREDFAAALLAFNRADNHRLGSPTLPPDGKLAAGDVVFVPMLAALESEYGSYLPKPGATPASFPGP